MLSLWVQADQVRSVDPQDPACGGVRGDDHPVAVVVDDPVQHRLEERAVPLLRIRELTGKGLRPVAHEDLGGHVDGVDQHPDHGTGCVAHGLEEKVHEDPAQLVPLLPDPDLRLPALSRLPGGQDLVEHLEVALPGHLG